MPNLNRSSSQLSADEESASFSPSPQQGRRTVNHGAGPTPARGGLSATQVWEDAVSSPTGNGTGGASPSPAAPASRSTGRPFIRRQSSLAGMGGAAPSGAPPSPAAPSRGEALPSTQTLAHSRGGGRAGALRRASSVTHMEHSEERDSRMQGGMEADGLMPRTIIDAPPERVRMPQSSMPNRDNQDMEDGNTSNLRVEQQLIDVTAPALEPVQEDGPAADNAIDDEPPSPTWATRIAQKHRLPSALLLPDDQAGGSSSVGGSGRREGVQGSAAPLPPGRAPSMVDLEKAMAMRLAGAQPQEVLDALHDMDSTPPSRRAIGRTPHTKPPPGQATSPDHPISTPSLPPRDAPNLPPSSVHAASLPPAHLSRDYSGVPVTPHSLQHGRRGLQHASTGSFGASATNVRFLDGEEAPLPLGEREPTIAGTGEVIGPLDRDAPVNGDEASVASTDYGDNETGLQRVRQGEMFSLGTSSANRDVLSQDPTAKLPAWGRMWIRRDVANVLAKNAESNTRQSRAVIKRTLIKILKSPLRLQQWASKTKTRKRLVIGGLLFFVIAVIASVISVVSVETVKQLEAEKPPPLPSPCVWTVPCKVSTTETKAEAPHGAYECRSNHVLFKCNDGQWEQEVDCTTTSTTIGGLAHVCQCSASCHASFAQCSFSSNVCNSMRFEQPEGVVSTP